MLSFARLSAKTDLLETEPKEARATPGSLVPDRTSDDKLPYSVRPRT